MMTRNPGSPSQTQSISPSFNLQSNFQTEEEPFIISPSSLSISVVHSTVDIPDPQSSYSHSMECTTLCIMQPLANPTIFELCHEGNRLNLIPLCRAWRKYASTTRTSPIIVFNLNFPDIRFTSRTGDHGGFYSVSWRWPAKINEGGIWISPHLVQQTVMTMAMVMKMRTKGPLNVYLTGDELALANFGDQDVGRFRSWLGNLSKPER